MYRGTYALIGSELSMFTRKLEAQLRYQNIPMSGSTRGSTTAGSWSNTPALASSLCSRPWTAGS